MDINSFKAGAAQTNITPPLGTLINGDFVSHYAYQIHDQLHSKALILQNQGTTIAIVVVDITAMQKDFIDEIKNKIFTQTNILPNNILISSTHTHAAGAVESLLLGAADLPYRIRLSDLIVQSVLRAKQNMRPAKIAFGIVNVPEHVVCRRYFMKPGYKAYNPVTGELDEIKTNPLGDENQIEKRENRVDPAVSYLAVKGTDNQWISLLANYSMHYVGDWENGVITADYFGVFAKAIQNKLEAGDDFVGMMSNGTSGDANIVDFLQPDRYPKEFFEKGNLIGKDIAEKVFKSMKNIQWETNPSLSAYYEEFPVVLRKPSIEEMHAAKKIVTETRYEHLSMKESSHTGNEDAFKRIYAREQVLLNEYPDTVLFPVQLLKIGSVMIGGLGGEFFAETGLWLKEKNYKNKYFTICLANGYVGYVPPAHEFGLGGYETWRCRSSFLEENAEEQIRIRLLQLVNASF